jgi:hypothetical protein
MESRSPDVAENKSRGNDVVFEIVVRNGGIGWSFRTGWEKPLKNFGDASLHPREFLSDFGKSYLFFFAFFFAAILFSSKLFEFHASVAGGARIQSHV